MKTYNIIVKGRVQGVFYRDNTMKKAIELGLKGTVRNLPTGEVEIFAQGDDKVIIALVEWCRKGPAYADVSEVKIKKTDKEEYTKFEIKL